MSIVHKKTAIAAALSGLLAASVALAASINPPTKPQTSPAMNAKEKANLDMVLDWWRVVIENGHVDDTVKYQAADYIQHKIDNNLYTASLVKQGPGTLIMTGDSTYEGGTAVQGGKLSITGSHASAIDVRGGTLGGSGFVGGRIDIDSGTSSPPRVTMRRSRSISTSSKRMTPAPG